MSDRILIVDDDDNIQVLLARLLTLEGIENVDVVSSGLEAIEYLASMRPSLVLLDVNMPGLDGWLVCEIINNVKRGKSIPVVFQTALQGSENIKRAVELGAHSYLEKPYTRDSVRQVLDAVLNRNRVTDQSVGQDLQMILRDLGEAAEHTLNLMAGGHAQTVRAGKVSLDGDDRVHDYVGLISSTGTGDLTLATGWPRNIASRAVTALTQVPEEQLDDEIILDGIQEFLNMVLGYGLRSIGRHWPMRLNLPSGQVGTSIGSMQNDIDFGFEFIVSSGGVEIPFLISWHTHDQF